jgi:hypothetical protein
MKIKIVHNIADPLRTYVTHAETGERIENLVGVKFEHNAGELPITTLILRDIDKANGTSIEVLDHALEDPLPSV